MILLFLRGILSSLFKFVGNVFEWIVNNPKQALIIVCLIVFGIFTGIMGYKMGLKKNSLVIAEYVKKEKARQERVAALEAESSRLGALLVENTFQRNTDIDAIAKQYQTRLAEEKKKTKVIVIRDPVSNKDIDVSIKNGEVVCNRFPDTFTQTVNEMVDRANKK